MSLRGSVGRLGICKDVEHIGIHGVSCFHLRPKPGRVFLPKIGTAVHVDVSEHSALMASALVWENVGFAIGHTSKEGQI